MLDKITENYLKNAQYVLLRYSKNISDVVSWIDEFSLSRSEKFDASRIESIQKSRFQALSNYVLSFVPFWREMKLEYFPNKREKNIQITDFPIINEYDMAKYRNAFIGDNLNQKNIERITDKEEKQYYLMDKRFSLRKENLLKRKARWNSKTNFNIFGCIAQSCDIGNGLHINTESFWVEIIDDNQKTLDSGKIGNIVVTDFDNLVMPFIRYEIGKTGMIDYRRCKCGKFLPRLFFTN